MRTQFFVLDHPVYESDRDYGRRNPVRLLSRYRVPGIVCPACGIWTWGDRLPVPLSPRVAKEFCELRYLPVEEWNRSRAQWARQLGVPAEDLTPGAALGAPMGECTAKIREEIVHPFPGVIWVNSRVRTVLRRSKLTGLTFAKVQLPARCGQVDMAELVIHGRATRSVAPPKTARGCKICGRRDFHAPSKLAIDEKRWDGKDFSKLTDNPNIIVVTERVAQVIRDENLTNLAVTPIGPRPRGSRIRREARTSRPRTG